ncbi:MAG: SLBB domain-containing protein [Fibromonadaceae bacterium]|jgi:protein involved in polysaccharide export with SLBB domain|nr:SLBB domain-containing protein [Fibromonadaceae bacterium]
MIRFFIIILMVLLSLANAADGSASKSEIQAISKPIFYEELLLRQRDQMVQNPVNLESPVDSNYKIGPGDFFEILFPSGVEGLQVSPEGTVAIQGSGIVYVNDIPLYEAKRKILDKLKNRYDQRYIGVHLVQLRKFMVNVHGAVWNPGQVTVSGQAKIMGAIYAAGNFKQSANKDSIYIYRKGDTIVTTENILLQAGDIIEVPYKEWQQTVNLILADKATTVPYVPNRTIKKYTEDAGINIEGGYNGVSVKYHENNFVKWIGINQIGSFSPEPSCDIEFHIQSPFVYIGGATAVVGKVPYNPSMHAADYVAASGVTIITGDFSRASVMRDGKKISVDWAKGEILPGDFIEIPRTAYEQIKDVTYFIASLIGILATTVTIYVATR